MVAGVPVGEFAAKGSDHGADYQSDTELSHSKGCLHKVAALNFQRPLSQS
jgi:hypothetical protein